MIPSDKPRGDQSWPGARDGTPEQRSGQGRIAVIDIGSNSVRLVVFDGLMRAPTPVFNEKIFAALGRTVGETGRLNPEGVSQAFSTLARFSRLLKAMDVASCHVVATAAVRDASDGLWFLNEVRARAGLDIAIISGEEEGRLSAEGVLSGIPEADGAMGDMGGGSVELVRLKAGAIGPRMSLPFGPFRLMTMGGSRGQLSATIDDKLATLPWLPDVTGASIYAVGGIWRAFAKIHMEQVGHPLHIIHHYRIEAIEAVEFAQLLARQSRASLEGSGISRRRLDALPYAALFMELLLKRARPRDLVFSAYGLREGILHDMLPPEVRARDPLLSACDDLAGRIGRFGDAGSLADWIRPLGPPFEAYPRLATAACILSDIGWLDHPDYRSEQAYLKALRAQFGGIDHVGRAFIALALHLRYGGRVDDVITAPSHALLDLATLGAATALGLALRLAYTLCGGATSLLAGASLTRERDRIVLRIAPEFADLRVDAVERRLDALAKAIGLPSEVRIAPPARRRA
jgi:exopolyphosphatase/guanosine-5'-triphosphate,3'-diphosphate pyrophosphatase